jgi:hypothetical protein
MTRPRRFGMTSLVTVPKLSEISYGFNSDIMDTSPALFHWTINGHPVANRHSGSTFYILPVLYVRRYASTAEPSRPGGRTARRYVV